MRKTLNTISNGMILIRAVMEQGGNIDTLICINGPSVKSCFESINKNLEYLKERERRRASGLYSSTGILIEHKNIEKNGGINECAI